MRKPKICGYDLNGFKDRAAKNWYYSAQGEEVIGDVSVTGSIVAPDVVRVGMARRGKWIGGSQARLAPHGRGGGWGVVGAVDRRIPVLEILHSKFAAQECLGAALSGHSSGAKFCAVSLEEDHPFSESLQDRLIAAISKEKLGRSLLIWRSVLVVLGLLAGKNSNLVIEDKHTVGVLTHSRSGMTLQKLKIKSFENGENTILAPERQQAAIIMEASFGYDALITTSKLKFSREIEQNQVMDTSLNQAIFELALSGDSSELLSRNTRGSFNFVKEKKLHIEFIENELNSLSSMVMDCDNVVFETLSSGTIKSQLVKHISESVGCKLAVADEDVVARGALEAARRYSKGEPVYFDFLPTISTIVLGEDGAKSFDLVRPDEILPAGRIYRSPEPAKFAVQPGQSEISIYLKKELIPHPRKASVPLGNKDNHSFPVELSVEQAPSSGRAKIFIHAPMLARQFLVDWEGAEELDKSWDELISDLSEGNPSVPSRLILPCTKLLWDGDDGSIGLSKLISQEKSRSQPDWELLAKQLSSRFEGAYCISSDGDIPDEINMQIINDLDELTNRAWEHAHMRLDGQSAESNGTLKFLTWQFRRAPEGVAPKLIQIISERSASGQHPVVSHAGSWVLFYQGMGRTCLKQNDEERAISILMSSDLSTWNWRNETAAMAFLLSRSDTAPLNLSERDIERLAKRIIQEFTAELGGSYTKFNYAPFLLGGLIRTRLKDRHALTVGFDPIAEQLAIAITRTRKDLQRLARKGWKEKNKADKYSKLLENLSDELTGKTSNPNLLVDLYNM